MAINQPHVNAGKDLKVYICIAPDKVLFSTEVLLISTTTCFHVEISYQVFPDLYFGIFYFTPKIVYGALKCCEQGF